MVIRVIGGGLAGSEAAWQLAQRGFQVELFEMRPKKTTGAHVTNNLGELVCSNSLGSKLEDRATGLLLHELKALRSMLIQCAEESAVPAGGALAVDRELFAEKVTTNIETHPKINVIREEVTSLDTDQPTIIATGPLTSDALAQEIRRLTGEDYLYFYDAIAPIVTFESIDMSVAFRGNRWDRGESADGDYINCPMTKEQYYRFVEALRHAETIELRDFEREDPNFFEGCIPIEQLANRGDDTLAYGPMRPVGLYNPHTKSRPYAVVQLRRDNLADSLYNIVGFQTNLRWGVQQEILRLIPGLEEAEFIRLGQMHRNTFINAPTLLGATMQFCEYPNLYFGGQITGVEGYAGNVATGLIAAINLARQLNSHTYWVPPKTTMIGALCHYVANAEADTFQPMKANLGILPPLEKKIKNKKDRKRAYMVRAHEAISQALLDLQDDLIPLKGNLDAYQS